MGVSGPPVRYALPESGVGSSGLVVTAVPTGVLVFWIASAVRFDVSAGHGSASVVDEPAASPGAWVSDVTTLAPLSCASLTAEALS